MTTQGRAAVARAPIAVALDARNVETAAGWAQAVQRYVTCLKIGLELFCRHGPSMVDAVRGGTGLDLFLDLKLHDIPATVAGAARSVARLRPTYVTVHAAGGADMVRAAVEAAPDVAIAGVTVLTSLSAEGLRAVGFADNPLDTACRLANVAVTAGARALVCSPHEVSVIRREVGPEITLITPGVRPAGASADDQARIATPQQALADGADLLVVGRPITGDSDPGAAAARLAASLSRP
ncbi:MAG: orotidine-5'-phosphate decarboxylase, partial [Mycobacteriales bacterium]